MAVASALIVVLVMSYIIPKSTASDLTAVKDDIKHVTLEQHQADLEKTKSVCQAEIETLKTELKLQKFETSTQLRQQQIKMDSLMEQNSVLTNQLTQFFNVYTQRTNDNATASTNGPLSSHDVPLTVNLQMEATGGVAYIRWGRTMCDGTAVILYQGYAASSKSASTLGGGSELLCLHNTPTWSTIVSGNQGYSPLVGVEYQFSSSPFSTANNNGATFTNNDMPCVMCHVQTRSFQIMIPGRKTCPSGWSLEYWGYMVATITTHYKGSFTCLDQAPETVPGGISLLNGSLAYPVESSCTALYCPPYVLGNEVTCVVCTK